MSNKAISAYASAFKRKQEEERKDSSQPRQKEPEKKNAEADVQEDTQTRANKRTHIRTTVRRTYDIFVDQVVALEELQLAHHKQKNRKPDLSELVREALDTYIKHEKKKFGVEE